MYNLAKLLSEEPRRIERIIILLIKLLVSLYVCGLLFGHNSSINFIFEDESVGKLNIARIIYFIAALIAIWFFLWSIIAEWLCCEIPVWLLCKWIKGRSCFILVLEILSVVSEENNRLSPKGNIVAFYDGIKKYSEQDDEFIQAEKSRIKQYYVVLIVVFTLFLLTKDFYLRDWEAWVISFILLNLFIYNVILASAHKYLQENIETIKKEFGHLAYAQRVIAVLKQNKFLKREYTLRVFGITVSLKRKEASMVLPEMIKINPIYFWSEILANKYFMKRLMQIRDRRTAVYEKIEYYDAVVCNVKMMPESMSIIQKIPGIAYVHCETDEQIYENIEILLFEITNGNYVMSHAPEGM